MLAHIRFAKWVVILVLSASYCSSLGAILEVLWTERGVGCADNRPGCSPTLATSLWPFNVPGDSSSSAQDQRLKVTSEWVLHVYFSLARSEGGMGTRNAEKAPYLWINLINQHLYRAFFVGRSRSSCMKIRLLCRLKPTHPSLKLPTAEIRCTAP